MRELELESGVGRETIRFYIREGLLPQPERPARNVALYDESFVERIRLINELKTKRYLPLQVIRRILAESEGPNAPEVTSLLALDGQIFPALESTTAPAPEPLEAIARRVGIPAEEIHELADVGAITAIRSTGSGDADTARNFTVANISGRNSGRGLRIATFTSSVFF